MREGAWWVLSCLLVICRLWRVWLCLCLRLMVVLVLCVVCRLLDV